MRLGSHLDGKGKEKKMQLADEVLPFILGHISYLKYLACPLRNEELEEGKKSGIKCIKK